MEKKYRKADQKIVPKLIQTLDHYYPDARCSLNFVEPIELVVALILAAQCTDERVNQITPVLFEQYPNVYSLAKASILDIQEIVKPCGFYINKANSISETANLIVQKFHGEVPNTMENLITLRGIGRKSANIILQECFHHTVGIAVDTHVTRIARKIGLSNSNTPEKIEQDLMKQVESKYWARLNHLFVYHGRAICIARNPQCDTCPISKVCQKNP